MAEPTNNLPSWEDSYPSPEAIENWQNFPPEELAKYAGLYVAYSWDGTRIVASGETPEILKEKLKAAGIDSSRVIHGYADPPDESCLGCL